MIMIHCWDIDQSCVSDAFVSCATHAVYWDLHDAVDECMYSTTINPLQSVAENGIDIRNMIHEYLPLQTSMNKVYFANWETKNQRRKVFVWTK